MLKNIKDQYEVIRATSYAATDHESDGQIKFTTYLVYQGWKCEQVDKSINTNIDVMLTTDLCNDRYVFDHKVVVLISCDGDYSYPLNMLSKAGYIINVIGAKDFTSLELLKVTDKVTYLEDLPRVVLEKKVESDKPAPKK